MKPGMKKKANKASLKQAGRESSMAPKNTTKRGKDTKDSKGPGPNGWTKGMTKKGC